MDVQIRCPDGVVGGTIRVVSDDLVVSPLTPADSAAIHGWRYAGPWSLYDPHPDDEPLEAADGYFAVRRAGTLIGFGCHGEEARVPGLDEEPGVVDIGVGMDPALVGQGLGREFAEAACRHVTAVTGGTRLRAVVQTWNERSIRLTRSIGFEPVRVHTCEQDGKRVDYLVVLRG